MYRVQESCYSNRHDLSAPPAPSSDILLNVESAAHEHSNKRKRDEADDRVLPWLRFVLRPHPSAPVNELLCFTQRLVLARSLLPLSYLDPTGANGLLPSLRLFCAKGHPIRDSAFTHEDYPEEQLLIIAELEQNGSIYAVEWVHHDIYAFCRLGDWLQLEDLQELAKARLAGDALRASPEALREVSGTQWWSYAAIDVSLHMQDREPRRRKNADSQRPRFCMGRPMCFAASNYNGNIENALRRDDTVLNEQIVTRTTHQQDVAEPSPEMTLTGVKEQYLEALYICKTSLAYFAKGPLSRARAAFQKDPTMQTEVNDLILFLRGLVLPLSVIDAKYRDVLPGLLENMPIAIFSDVDPSHLPNPTSRKKIKSKRRLKVGKDGLFSLEEEYLARWWTRRDLTFSSKGNLDHRQEDIRSSLHKQRIRETELQVILILEINALEATQEGKNLTVDEIEPTNPSVNILLSRKKKEKQPQDLKVLLELLIDRLCIWHSMNSDEVRLPGENAEKGSKDHGDTLTGQQVDDRLRDFCTEVVIPFYRARLPDLSIQICHKLGGPIGPSPRRPPLAKMASTLRLIRNVGAVTQSQSTRKPRKTLERVFTDDLHRLQRPPSLVRSSTDSAVIGLKEVENKPLSLISVNRLRVQKAHRFSQREVDLDAVSKATEAKLKKKISFEQELKGAIAALKKPNPRLAVKELLESSERRVAESTSRSRKSKQPMRKILAHGVQVKATPKGNRHIDVFGDVTRPIQWSIVEPKLSGVMLLPSGSSNGPHVPSSLVKSRVASQPAMDGLQATPTNTRFRSNGIEQTSIRDFAQSDMTCTNAQHIDLLRCMKADQFSPDFPRYTATCPPANLQPKNNFEGRLSSTMPSVPITKPNIVGSPKSYQSGRAAHIIEQTPVQASKLVDKQLGADCHPSQLKLERLGTSESVYESLGWDDEVDEPT